MDTEKYDFERLESDIPLNCLSGWGQACRKLSTNTEKLLTPAVVGSALASTLGLAVVLDVPLSMALQILPSLLLAVGMCASVHLLVIFYQAIDGGSNHVDAIAEAFAHSGLAVFLASFTARPSPSARCAIGARG